MSESATDVAPTAAQAPEQLIVCESVVRIFQHGSIEVPGLELHVAAGEMMAVVGPSGAGKSTLLSILAGAHAPTVGTVRVAGRTSRACRGATA